MDGYMIETPSSWIFNYPQRSQSWLELRKGRITGSNVSACIGDSIFSTPQSIARVILGLEKIEENDNIRRGIIREPLAADWYTRHINPNIQEVGFIIPKWDPSLGVSPDRLVGNDGLLEIKCPRKMYPNLISNLNNQCQLYPLDLDRKNHLEPKFFSDNYQDDPRKIPIHIYTSHYQQMEMQMIISQRWWCDYMVFSPNDNWVYIQRVFFNLAYWENYMYPKIKNFQNSILFKS